MHWQSARAALCGGCAILHPLAIKLYLRLAHQRRHPNPNPCPAPVPHCLRAGATTLWARQAMQRVPTRPPGGAHVLFEHFWVEAGPLPVPDGAEGGPPGFVITPSVAAHLRNLARAALIRRYPILLQARARPEALHVPGIAHVLTGSRALSHSPHVLVHALQAWMVIRRPSR